MCSLHYIMIVNVTKVQNTCYKYIHVETYMYTHNNNIDENNY